MQNSNWTQVELTNQSINLTFHFWTKPFTSTLQSACKDNSPDCIQTWFKQSWHWLVLSSDDLSFCWLDEVCQRVPGSDDLSFCWHDDVSQLVLGSDNFRICWHEDCSWPALVEVSLSGSLKTASVELKQLSSYQQRTCFHRPESFLPCKSHSNK